jgi:hypothetical protein
MKLRSLLPIRMSFALGLLLLGLLNLWACSPVAFTTEDTSGDVANPCPVGVTGTSDVTQSVTFTDSNRVDVLVVVDNSNSYAKEDQSLGNPLNGFVSGLNSSGLDWQIGVTTTDVCPQSDAPSNLCAPGDQGTQGLLVGPSIPQTPGATVYQTGPQFIVTPGVSAQAQFDGLVVRDDSFPGANGYPSGDSRAIFAANLAIDQANSGNAGFFRDNSNLAVIIISDEDERSVGGLIPSNPGYAPLSSYDLPQTLMNKVATVWGGNKSLLVNTIIINPGDVACFNYMQANDPLKSSEYGNIYAELSGATNGIQGSICAPSYQTMLSNITGAIGEIPVSNTVTLNYVPNSAPTITFIPASNAVGYTWTTGTNQVVFNTRPANGTQVTFSYAFTP